MLAFSHVSHVYRTGASIYVTYLFRLAETAEETRERWQSLKAGASRAILDFGGTISHHHGVGIDHKPYLAAEKGEEGMKLLSNIVFGFDPEGIMNPGKLLDDAHKKGK